MAKRNSKNLFANSSNPAPARFCDMSIEDIEALSVKKANKSISQAIMRIVEHLCKRTCIDRTRITEDLYMCVAKDTEGGAAFYTARYEHAIIDMIDMIVVEGVEMTVALPTAWHKHNIDTMPEDLRPVLNLITPYQTDQRWTCATLAKPRNAVATWGIAQGCFVEVIVDGDGGTSIMRIDRAKGYELATREVQDATGTLVRKPIVTFLWPAKAARCRKYAARVGIPRETMDAILLSFGCPQSVLDELESASTSARRATISKEAKQKALYRALLAALDDDDDDDDTETEGQAALDD